MKESFFCFYEQSNEDLRKLWKDEKTLFVFDTNVLLGLYSFEKESFEAFIKVLDSLRDRIWIPFHVGLEYQRNRLSVIKKRRSSFKKLVNNVKDLESTIEVDYSKFECIQREFSLKSIYPSIYEEFKKVETDLRKEINMLLEKHKENIKTIEKTIEKVDSDKIFISSPDYIRDKLGEYFKGDKIGQNLYKTQEKLTELETEGNKRYSALIPPGYEDAKTKKEEVFSFNGLIFKRKFGDLIIFKEIINHAKTNGLKNIIFISEDIKPDWRIVEEFSGKKILGAQPDLKRELFVKADVENFIILQLNEFIEHTNKVYNTNIKNETIKIIKSSLLEQREQIKKEELNNSFLQKNIIKKYNVHNKKDEDIHGKWDILEKEKDIHSPWDMFEKEKDIHSPWDMFEKEKNLHSKWDMFEKEKNLHSKWDMFEKEKDDLNEKYSIKKVKKSENKDDINQQDIIRFIKDILNKNNN